MNPKPIDLKQPIRLKAKRVSIPKPSSPLPVPVPPQELEIIGWERHGEVMSLQLSNGQAIKLQIPSPIGIEDVSMEEGVLVFTLSDGQKHFIDFPKITLESLGLVGFEIAQESPDSFTVTMPDGSTKTLKIPLGPPGETPALPVFEVDEGRRVLVVKFPDGRVKEIQFNITQNITGGGGRGIHDAPKDGSLYGRVDGQWIESIKHHWTFTA